MLFDRVRFAHFVLLCALLGVWEASSGQPRPPPTSACVYPFEEEKPGGGAPPEVTFRPREGDTYQAPADISVSVEASDPDRGEIALSTLWLDCRRPREQPARIEASGAVFDHTWRNVLPGGCQVGVRVRDADGDFADTCVNVVVASQPSIAVTSPGHNSVVVQRPPANMALVALANVQHDSISSVEFFRSDGLSLGFGSTAGAVQQGEYRFTWTNRPAGVYEFYAVAYATHGSARSSNVRFRLNAPPAVAMTDPVAGTIADHPVTIVLRANASDADGTVSRVQFQAKLESTPDVPASWSNVGQADTIAPYEVNWTPTAARWTLAAKARDNDGVETDSARISVIVDGPPTVSVTQPVPGAVVPPDQAVTLAASASDVMGVTQVQFLVDGAAVGSADTTAPYEVSWTPAGGGARVITAEARDARGKSTVSAPVNVSVNHRPTVAITAPANNTISHHPDPIELTASASDVDGSIALIEYYSGTNKIGESDAPPEFRFQWTTSTPGSHNVTARATDDRGASGTSAGITLIVNARPAIAVASPLTGSIVDEGSTVALASTASDADGTVDPTPVSRTPG